MAVRTSTNSIGLKFISRITQICFQLRSVQQYNHIWFHGYPKTCQICVRVSTEHNTIKKTIPEVKPENRSGLVEARKNCPDIDLYFSLQYQYNDHNNDRFSL